MSDWTFFLIIGLVGVGLGLGLGALASGMREPVKNAQRNADSQEVLVLRRNKRTSALEVYVRGQKLPGFRTLNATSQETMRKIIYELQVWIGEPVQNISTTVQPPNTPTPVTPLTQEMQDVRAEVHPPSMNMVDIVARAVNPGIREIPTASLSIVGQIDHIMQEKLSDPQYLHLAQLGIRLLDHPEKGMVVQVGLEEYESVDSLPNAEVRELIRSCVKVWEDRNV